MTDAEARDYGIAALEGFALELEGAIEHSRELNAYDYIDRMRTSAGRLDQEREHVDADGGAFLRLVGIVEVLERSIDELDERVEFLSGRVLGGVPRAGVVPLDGPELEREKWGLGDGITRVLVEQNIERARRGLPLLSRTVRQ